ncbi:deoxyuridine 5'-triphosphate nucleotidohydrolase [Ligilactobacillus salitolerans]|uniref:dUTP diphosphatase n=1 Tax=Ligilactobacillus salitolerans TaxID=1808352 RepID=A0A401IUS4_9LACO|nr:dUTP diphosphatase [Ligilactobacillus salitolerans]GBG95279.1 deoxyuridine 5'-triphosphate nucleotidohydrolase [Ligilactobacillus salitolerans]
MKRGFKKVSKYADQEVRLPQRSTQQAAGYDFFASEDFVVPSIWKGSFLKVLAAIVIGQKADPQLQEKAQKILKPSLVPTGIKAYMAPDEYLLLADRSSAPLKRGLVLPNGVGIIDADYFDNPNNEGEIFFQLLNFSLFDQTIKRGEKIGQGIFMPFLLADGEEKPQTKRTGGFGSSGR